MLKVYRFEHVEDGVGPLCGKILHRFEWEQMFYEHMFPCYDDDFVDFCGGRPGLEDGDRDEYVFGWDDLEKVVAFIKPGAEEILESNGFELMEYEVHKDYVIMKDGQVCFNKKIALRTA